MSEGREGGREGGREREMEKRGGGKEYFVHTLEFPLVLSLWNGVCLAMNSKQRRGQRW